MVKGRRNLTSKVVTRWQEESTVFPKKIVLSSEFHYHKDWKNIWGFSSITPTTNVATDDPPLFNTQLSISTVLQFHKPFRKSNWASLAEIGFHDGASNLTIIHQEDKNMLISPWIIGISISRLESIGLWKRYWSPLRIFIIQKSLHSLVSTIQPIEMLHLKLKGNPKRKEENPKIMIKTQEPSQTTKILEAWSCVKLYHQQANKYHMAWFRVKTRGLIIIFFKTSNGPIH